MANISIKKDFKDGDKLLAQQLNNNFSVIEAGVNANEADLENVIQDAENRLKTELEAITADRGWDWNEGDRVTFFKGSEEEVANQEVKDGQLLYNETTGETYLDNEGKRIVTGSGNVVSVGSEQPANTATKIWVDPEEIGEPLPHQLVVSPEEPATGEEVWFKNDEQKAVMVKDKDGNYKEFVKPQVKVGVEEPTTGEEVWIKKGKNLLKVEPQTLTLNGVTMTVSSDGSVILNGTATANTSMSFGSSDFYGVGDYAFGVTTDFSSIGYGFEVGGYVHNVDGSYKYNLSTAHPTRTFLEGEYVENFNVFFLSGATFNNLILYPQLERGTTPTSFEPYVDKEVYVKNANGVYEEFINVEEAGFDNYSLSEQRIGTWIDGKPLYRKVVSCGAMPLSTKKEISTGLSGVTYLRVEGFATFNNYSLPLPFPSSSNVNSSIQLGVFADVIIIKTASSDYGAYANTYVILEYTKN